MTRVPLSADSPATPSASSSGAPAPRTAHPSSSRPSPHSPAPTVTAPSSSPGASPVSVDVAPGAVVRVRDEDWLVTQVSSSSDGTLVTVQGLSELVRDTTAQFSAGIDRIEPVDPRRTQVVADTSIRHRLSRLWLEATLRKTALPAASRQLAVVGDVLADPLEYQLSAVRQALRPDNLRPRILLADAVGLGKTLEIGMILAELVRRGRGDRILIVTPRHVLEQMQHEMWSRFALPFVRLDSQGIQRVRRRVPATRNPFSVYSRAIISIDTLKNDRYLAHLRKQHWDAAVIDESHNVTNKGTLNNRLAAVLARQTDALILASATPHNGDPKSFAELIRLLEPTAVHADGTLDEEAVKRLVIRRHRHSDEVRDVVGGRWQERLPPVNRLVAPSAAEGWPRSCRARGCIDPMAQLLLAPRRHRRAVGVAGTPCSPGILRRHSCPLQRLCCRPLMSVCAGAVLARFPWRPLSPRSMLRPCPVCASWRRPRIRRSRGSIARCLMSWSVLVLARAVRSAWWSSLSVWRR